MWYFSNKECRLRYCDLRKIEDGVTHKVAGNIIPCRWGLHACDRITDALKWAPGPILWNVDLDGTIKREIEKYAASERTYNWHLDATDLLVMFCRYLAIETSIVLEIPRTVMDFLRDGTPALAKSALDIINYTIFDRTPRLSNQFHAAYCMRLVAELVIQGEKAIELIVHCLQHAKIAIGNGYYARDTEVENIFERKLIYMVEAARDGQVLEVTGPGDVERISSRRQGYGDFIWQKLGKGDGKIDGSCRDHSQRGQRRVVDQVQRKN